MAKKDYKKLVDAEKKVIDKNLGTLKKFIKTKAYEALEEGQQILLSKQVDVMDKFSSILRERLALLKRK